VFVVACRDDNDSTPASTPAHAADITLTTRDTRSPGSTPPGLPVAITGDIRTLQPLDRTATRFATPTPLPLGPLAPVCYETISGGVLCLGGITNPYPHPIERVILHVEVYRADASLLDEAYVTLPQRIVPPGETAPYRALFGQHTPATQFGGVQAAVVRAERAPETPRLDVVFEAVMGDMLDEVYRVSTVLRNASPQEIGLLRVVVTLFDDQDRVLGFRVVELDSLAAQTSREITLDIRPQVTGGEIRPQIYAERMD